MSLHHQQFFLNFLHWLNELLVIIDMKIVIFKEQKNNQGLQFTVSVPDWSHVATSKRAKRSYSLYCLLWLGRVGSERDRRGMIIVKSENRSFFLTKQYRGDHKQINLCHFHFLLKTDTYSWIKQTPVFIGIYLKVKMMQMCSCMHFSF